MPARTDHVDDPELAASLVLARRGQAYWARELGNLRDDEFDAPSGLPGWSRRHVIAHVGYNARALARLVEGARLGVEATMYGSEAQRADEIDFGATLPTEALRNLCAHAAVHLNVEWRDLPTEAWSRPGRTAQGRTVPTSETVWMRTREVWLHAVDLRHGASIDDFPAELLDLLLADLVRVWRRKRTDGDPDFLLRPSDRTATYRVVEDGTAAVTHEVSGTAADLVGWGSGRTDGAGVTMDGAPATAAPAWL